MRGSLNIKRPQRSLLATGAVLVFALLVGTGVTLLNQDQSAQAADTGTATLTSVTTTQVGTNQTGEDATHILNNNIIKYQANYTFTTAGTVTVTATLPSGMIWSDATVLAANGCGAGSSLNADKNIATCVLSNTNVGITSWSLSATVYGGNGATVQPTFTDSNGVSTTKPTAVTIVASPKYNLSIAGPNPNTSIPTDGKTGVNMVVGFGIYAPITPDVGVLGLEPLKDGQFSFTLDTSTLPSNWTADCYTGPVNIVGYPSFGQLKDPGDITKCKKSLDGQTLTVTVSDAYTGGTVIPSLNVAGGSIGNNAWYSTGRIEINIPLANLTPAGMTYTLPHDNFTAIGASGSANNGATSSTNYSVWVSSSLRYYFHGYGFWGYNSNWINSWDNASPIYAGGDFYWTTVPKQLSPAGLAINNPQLCYTFDPSQLQLLSANIASQYSGYPVTMEYGVFSNPLGDPRNCGRAGDGAEGWYPTKAAAEAAGSISAVRSMATGNIMYGGTNGEISGNEVGIVNLRLQLAQNLPSGTQVPLNTCVYSDNTAKSCVTSGRYIVAINAGVTNSSVTFSNDTVHSPTIPAGGTETITITALARAPTGLSAQNVTETVTLPAGLSYVSGSATFDSQPIANPSEVDNSDGSKTLTFNLGDLPPVQNGKQLVFRVNVASTIVMPSTATVTAIIGSDEEQYMPVLTRTKRASFDITATAQFGVTVSQSAESLHPGDSQEYTFTTYNTRSDTVTDITEINVLPYDGDSRGTSGLTSYRVSEFSGSAGLALYYTTAEAVRTNPSSGSVAWVAYSGGALPTGITAVKWTLAAMPSDSVGVSLTLSDIVADNNAVIGNSISYVSSSVGDLGESLIVSASYIIPPIVTAISPNKLTTETSGVVATITGTNFTNASSVTIGGEACTNIVITSSTSLTCTLPSFTTDGVKSVLVTTPGGTNSANTLFTVVNKYITLSVPSSLSVSVDPNKLSSGLNPVTVSTNNPTGYNLSMLASSANLTNVSLPTNIINSINGYSAGAPASAAQASALIGHTPFWAYRVTGQDGFGAATTAETNTATTAYSWSSVPTADTIIRTGTVTDDLTTNTPQTTDTWFAISPTMETLAGQYQATLTYTALAQP